MFMIMNDRGLRAIMDSQLKLGADAAVTFVDLGGGVEGATTTALTADIVGFSRARGLFAGISLGGSMMSAKSDWNEAYYGRPVGVQNIVRDDGGAQSRRGPAARGAVPLRHASRARRAARASARARADPAAAGAADVGPATAVNGSATALTSAASQTAFGQALGENPVVLHGAGKIEKVDLILRKGRGRDRAPSRWMAVIGIILE